MAPHLRLVLDHPGNPHPLHHISAQLHLVHLSNLRRASKHTIGMIVETGIVGMGEIVMVDHTALKEMAESSGPSEIVTVQG